MMLVTMKWKTMKLMIWMMINLAPCQMYGFVNKIKEHVVSDDTACFFVGKF